jgi:hypothetical protein
MAEVYNAKSPDGKNRRRHVIDEKEIKQLWAKASPTERKGISFFVGLKPREKAWRGSKADYQDYKVLGEYRYHLVHIRNLDTGRVFLACGLHNEPLEGPTRTRMMELFGMEPPAVLVKFERMLADEVKAQRGRNVKRAPKPVKRRK